MAIVIKQLHPKEGLEKGLERCWIAAKSTCRICPSLNNFLQTPVLFIEYTPNPLGDSNSLFCVYISTFSLEQRFINFLKLSRGSFFLKPRVLNFFVIATEQQQSDFCNYPCHGLWYVKERGFGCDSCRLEQLASFLRRHPELGIGTSCHTPQGSVMLT